MSLRRPMTGIHRCGACGRLVVAGELLCAGCGRAERALAAASASETRVRAALYPPTAAVELVPPAPPPLRALHGLHPGAVVAGRYVLLERVGSGGSATVYRARDLAQGREVAIKTLRPELVEDEVAAERLRQEARSLERLRHPNIVQTFDHGVSDGVRYIAMEHVPGRSLKDVVAADAPLRPARAIRIVLDVLEAIRFTHAHDIVHRDLTCANVIVDPHGRVKVSDFGIACRPSRGTSKANLIVGTIGYVAPERLMGQAGSEACDIYSIGVMLYELVTGRLPFRGPQVSTIALKHLHERPVSPARLNRAVSAGLGAIIMRALEKAPEDRFADADAFAAALRREAASTATARLDGAREIGRLPLAEAGSARTTQTG